jgi:hypothetical protein
MSIENLVSAARAAGFSMALENDSAPDAIVRSADDSSFDGNHLSAAPKAEPLFERWQGSTQPAEATRSGSVLDWLPGFSWKA